MDSSQVATGILETALLEGDPWQATARALDAAVPGRAAMLYDWRTPREIGRLAYSFKAGSDTWTRIVRGGLPELVGYRPDQRESISGRPVTLARVLRAPGQAEMFRETLCSPLGVYDHLRVTLWERGRFVAWCGSFRGPRERFTDGDRRAMRSLIPQIRAVLATERLIRGERRDLGAVVDALPDPAFLVGSSGLLLHANQTARRMWHVRPSWLNTRNVHAIDPEQAHVARVGLNGMKVWLVLPRGGDEGVPSQAPLPASLVDIARGIVDGLSDKEIAERTGRPLRTVRTYVERLYRRLGVGSRVQAVRALWRVRAC